MNLSEQLRGLERQGIDLVGILSGDVEIAPGELCEILRRLPRGSEDMLYGELLEQLTLKRLPEDEARRLWELVARHKERMNVRLGRNVGFRVAYLDYLSNVQARLRHVRLVAGEDFEEIVSNADLDGLTGVYNRRYFNLQFKREIDRAQRYAGHLSLLLVDVDGFKLYNDTRGHVAGDGALKRIAGCLTAAARVTDYVCRYGGDEFGVVCPRTVKHDALTLAERLRKAVQDMGLRPDVKPAGRVLALSVGVASFPDDGRTSQELVEVADRQLYHAKEEQARMAETGGDGPHGAV